MQEIKADIEIDVRGLSCPRPLLKTKQQLSTMERGQILHVISSDETTRITIPAYLDHSGDQLIQINEDGAVLHHFIKKK